MTRPGQHLHVRTPRTPVEIDGEQRATVIGKQRIDTDDLAPLKMGKNLTVVERGERLVAAFSAADLGLPAHAALPLVRAPR